MFDLLKDIDKYSGIPPYDSELYGVYQPLLGWQSNLTKKWVQRGGSAFEPRVKKILDLYIAPGPDHVDILQNGLVESMIAQPLRPGAGRFPLDQKPVSVLLAKDLGSSLLEILRERVQTFARANGGRLPNGDEWRRIADVDNLMDEQNGALRKANDWHFARLKAEAMSRAPNGQLTASMVAEMQKAHLALVQFESQMAAFVLLHAQGQGDYKPDELKKLFVVKDAPALTDILTSADPLAGIDPTDASGALAAVGFVHLFRQYFFDLGTFLGEPVEHVWLAPGTTIELVEISTRRVLVEKALESSTESTQKAERASTNKEDISEAVKEDNENSTKLGVSQANKASLYVYEGTVSANLSTEDTRKTSRETAHKQNREQSEKLSSEIKQSFRSIFRTVTETTDTRSRRHIMANPGNELVNYELRRKMRRGGVQVQDIGTRLCWQVFVDDPGIALGLAELVHLAQSPELANLKEPERIPEPTTFPHKVVVPFPFKPVLNYWNFNLQYEYEGHADGDVNKPQLARVRGPVEDDDSQIVVEHTIKVDPPRAGYRFKTDDVRMVGVQGGKLAILRSVAAQPDGTIQIVMQRVNFGGENFLNLEFELHYEPEANEVARVTALNKDLQDKYDDEKRRLIQRSYLEAVRKRITDASALTIRPSWDLREEERTVVYRRLIERLMLDGWKLPDNDANRRLSHVRSELVRSIFDVDSMLYFVAPEWWMPRRHQSKLDLAVDLNVPAAPASLTDEDRMTWGGENRPDNYKITESSKPARLGSSLGWLLQLDGDNLRNAFLNAPWVKAVIPIRPGREKAALNWLKALEGHADDGWDTDYLGTEPEFEGKTVGEVLDIVADKLEKANGTIAQTLAADKVFEHGFDHLAGGFDAGLAPNEVFSQWISVLPTDQIVAMEYKATDLLR